MTTEHTDPYVTMDDDDDEYDVDRVLADFLEQSIKSTEEEKNDRMSLLAYKVGTGAVTNKKLSMKEEIDGLSEEDRKIYQNSLGRHTVPTDPQFKGALEHITKYTMEQSRRFLAMVELWKQTEELKSNILPRYTGPVDDLMVDTVTGHYGLYQITRQFNNSHTATAVHRDLWDIRRMRIEVGSTILADDGSCYLTPLHQLLPGDTIAVKEVAFVDGMACATKFCLFKRSVNENQTIHIGKNLRPVVFGTGKAGITAEDPKSLVSGSTHQADIFYPVKCPASSRNACLPMTQPVVLKYKENLDLNKKEISFNSIRNCRYTPDLLEYLAVMGSSAITAVRRGVWDTLHHSCTFREEDGFLKFGLRSTSPLWSPGTQIGIAGVGQAVITYTDGDLKKDRWMSITAKPLGNLNFENLKADPTRWVFQVMQRAPPILPLGFYEKMEDGTNGKKIVKALYGESFIGVDGEDIERHGFEVFGVIEQLPNQECPLITPLDRTYPITLDAPQSTYIHRLVRGAFPITVANFPVLSGKTSTVVIAALEAAKARPGTQHLVFVPDELGAQSLVERMESIQAESKVSAVRMIELSDWRNLSDNERTHLDYPVLLRQFVQEVVAGKYGLEEFLIKKATEYKEGTDDIFWLCNYFEKVRPQIIISKFETIFSNTTIFQFLDKVATIQLDNADQIPQIDLIQTCVQFPSARYGLIGDAVKDRPSFPGMSNPQVNLTIGWLIEKSITQRMFPIVTSNHVYGGVNAKIVELIGNVYYKDRELRSETKLVETVNYLEKRPDIWSNPLYPVKILKHCFEHFGREHRLEKDAEQLELLEKLVKTLAPIPMDHIGVLCFLNRHLPMLHKTFHNSGITYGLPDAFHGIQKEILIIWGGFGGLKEGLTMHESTFALTRGKQAVFILSQVDDMKLMKPDRKGVSWKDILNIVKTNGEVKKAKLVENKPEIMLLGTNALVNTVTKKKKKGTKTKKTVIQESKILITPSIGVKGKSIIEYQKNALNTWKNRFDFANVEAIVFLLDLTEDEETNRKFGELVQKLAEEVKEITIIPYKTVGVTSEMMESWKRNWITAGNVEWIESSASGKKFKTWEQLLEFLETCTTDNVVVAKLRKKSGTTDKLM